MILARIVFLIFEHLVATFRPLRVSSPMERDMRNLTIGDLKLALRELLGPNLAELRKSQTGKMYEQRLRAKATALDTMPDPASRAMPLADALASKDAEHDGLGTAIHYFCLAVEAHPNLAVAVKMAAKETRESFVPQLGILRRPYADEAAAALENQPEITRLKNELKSLATPGGGSLITWVKDFVDAGNAIDAMLRERAKLVSTGENASGAAPLRSATVGLLGRFRDALRDEIEEPDSALPKDHESKLFAYMDQLAAQRASPTSNGDSTAPTATESETAAPG